MNKTNISLKILFIIFCLSLFVYREYLKFVQFNDGLLHVYFLNVGQGDGFLVKTPNNKLILIDGGPDESVLFRLGKILPFWVSTIDIGLISHFHKDHYTGAYYVAKNFNVENLFYGEINDLDLLQVVFDFNRGHQLKANTKIYEEGRLAVYAYPFSMGSRLEPTLSENYNTVFYELSYGDFEVLFTGDAPSLAQNKFDFKNIDILKVPHQGSKYDLVASFVDKINPAVAIISVGPNSYGHPHSEVLKFYKGRNIDVHRTDEVTNFILISSDGLDYSFSYH